ncbi:hypothetical protein [Psychroserpens damuponensis]|uniref:hypothetical protein n=1 Tax=Psychroserpens damuponensis TaxID=943936 RepID=UPI00058F4E19|nr:hypothetical protein [Psychroserpens damuponensis]
MILNTTHLNKAHKITISKLVGSSFSFIKSIQMGGIGSKRMIIDKVSPNLQQYINKVSDINYANIEMRPNGILIYINKGLNSFTWIIPFYHLVIYKTNGLSIHAQGKYINFKNNNMFKDNKVFMSKLMDAKVKFDERYSFQF